MPPFIVAADPLMGISERVVFREAFPLNMTVFDEHFFVLKADVLVLFDPVFAGGADRIVDVENPDHFSFVSFHSFSFQALELPDIPSPEIKCFRFAPVDESTNLQNIKRNHQKIKKLPPPCLPRPGNRSTVPRWNEIKRRQDVNAPQYCRAQNPNTSEQTRKQILHDEKKTCHINGILPCSSIYIFRINCRKTFWHALCFCGFPQPQRRERNSHAGENRSCPLPPTMRLCRKQCLRVSQYMNSLEC